MELLSPILNDAVKAGVESVHLEWESEGLEIMFRTGNTGVGSVLSDRPKAAPLEPRRALFGPIITLAVVGLATIGLTLLSAHLRNEPPDPAVGKSERDPLVRGIILIGPFGVLLLGAPFILGSLIWMYFRMKSPPLINVIQPVRASSVPPSDSESVEIKKKPPTIAMKRHGDHEYLD